MWKETLKDPYEYYQCCCWELVNCEPIGTRRYGHRWSEFADVLWCNWIPDIADCRTMSAAWLYFDNWLLKDGPPVELHTILRRLSLALHAATGDDVNASAPVVSSNAG